MKTAGPGLRHHVIDIAGTPAILCGERVGLDFRFLYGIHRWHVNDSAPIGGGVPVSVQQVGAGSKVAATEIQERDVLVGSTGLPASVEQLELRRVVHGRVE